MTFDFQRVLVTGGAGFIGSHLVEALVEQGRAVTVLDDLSSGHPANLAVVKDRISFHQGDITDLKMLDDLTKGVEVIFHQAAVVSVTQTVDDPVTSTEVNDLGTIKVLEAARRNGVRRVVMASSSAVYGDAPQLPKIESMIPAPLSPYAVQKLTNEYYAGLYHRLYGLETVCLRYFNVYGPRQDPSSPYSGVISIFMSCALSGRQPLIYGDGSQTRDFVYVNDVVQANLLAASREAAVGKVFNVGTSDSIEINRLWQMIADISGCPLPARHDAPRPGDIVHSLAGIQRAREALGFEPRVIIENGVRRTFEWYRQNQGRA